MLTEQSFRERMPMFASAENYPTAQISLYLGLGLKLLDERRWGELREEGLMFFLAHYLSLFHRSMSASKMGADAGKIVGNETSKSVDSVSKSMDVSSVTIDGAGHWNQTTWGVQFLQLQEMIGAGGIQL